MIVNDPHPNLAVQKSRQLGLTEIGIGKLLHFVDTNSYDAVKALFAFPTNRQMSDMVKSRLNPLLDDGYYSTIINKDMDSIETKRIRDSFLYFRSSSKASAMEGVDIDYLALDEYDRVPAASEDSALRSMDSSKYKITNRWSTPTLPSVGINRLFQQSDQRWYLHKCDKCNHWNQMSYEYYDESNLEASGNIKLLNPDGVDVLAKTVVPGSFQYVCQKCGKPLDRWYNGSWVPAHPDRAKNGLGTRGYMISQMNAVWVDASDLKTLEMNAGSKQLFYNYVLGYPYEDTQLAVVPDDIFSHTYDKQNPVENRGEYKFISVGIDWGNTSWVTVYGMRNSGQIDLLNLFPVQRPSATDVGGIGKDVEEIIVKLTPYDPDIIVADTGDSGDKIARLMKHFGEDKVFGCTYKSSPRSTGEVVPSWSDNTNRVTVDKLTQNKIFIRMLKGGQIHHFNNPDHPQLKQLAFHWSNVVIRDEEDDRTGETYQVIGRKGDDHYSQASVYAMLGWERLREIYYGGTRYEFHSTSIDLAQNTGPQMPDIFNEF